MKAMILAAGLGTRLRPLTNDRPKALVEIGGRTLLQITLLRLQAFGVEEVIVNVHHFADMVEDYLKAHDNFGMRIEISREEELLDTGGGLKKAGWFFREGSGQDQPFILHNVDVFSTIDLHRMVQSHRDHKALATLAVQKRKTSRYLLFDDRLQLCGRRSGPDGVPELVRECVQVQALAFSGVHVISPRIFERMTDAGAFSIIPTYLRLSAQGETIAGFPADEYEWMDLGRPENIVKAESELAGKSLS
jgi:NDP-sugar pyrophosphorylase family protein